MRNHSLMVFVLIIGAIEPAIANEQPKKSIETVESEPLIVTKAPFENHWDSSSWEAGSSDSFWHTEPSAAEVTRKKSKNPKLKNSRIWTRKPNRSVK